MTANKCVNELNRLNKYSISCVYILDAHMCLLCVSLCVCVSRKLRAQRSIFVFHNWLEYIVRMSWTENLAKSLKLIDFSGIIKLHVQLSFKTHKI